MDMERLRSRKKKKNKCNNIIKNTEMINFNYIVKENIKKHNSN